jgi:hypothetical protein
MNVTKKLGEKQTNKQTNNNLALRQEEEHFATFLVVVHPRVNPIKLKCYKLLENVF